jgi:hypothetical protein
VLTVICNEPCPEVILHPEGTVHIYETAPATLCMLYTSPAKFGQTDVSPLIVPGVCATEFTVTDWQEGEEVMLHALVAVTQMLPPLVPEVALMEFVPCPLLMTQPAGTVHV